MQRINTFLDQYVLPWPVKYLTNRLTILGTLSLLVPLILLANVTVFVLATNSYLNVMSVVVSSTVLLYSTLSEKRDKAAEAQREQIAAKHTEMMEMLANADHERIREIDQHLEAMQAEIKNHVNAELAEIKKLLMEELNDLHSETMLNADRMRDNLLERLDSRLASVTIKPPPAPPTP